MIGNSTSDKLDHESGVNDVLVVFVHMILALRNVCAPIQQEKELLKVKDKTVSDLQSCGQRGDS